MSVVRWVHRIAVAYRTAVGYSLGTGGTAGHAIVLLSRLGSLGKVAAVVVGHTGRFPEQRLGLLGSGELRWLPTSLTSWR